MEESRRENAVTASSPGKNNHYIESSSVSGKITHYIQSSSVGGKITITFRAVQLVVLKVDMRD